MKPLFIAILPLVWLAPVQAEDLPQGKGKDVIEKVCGGCHEAAVVNKYHNSEDQWQAVADDMRGRGALGSDEEFQTIITYLTHFFGPEVNVNKAGAAELEKQLAITSAEAGAIVKYREAQAAFKAFSDLRKVPGLDMTKLEPIQQRIVF
jgi:competence ComEA-like helix-hairpin-helix protein